MSNRLKELDKRWVLWGVRRTTEVTVASGNDQDFLDGEDGDDLEEGAVDEAGRITDVTYTYGNDQDFLDGEDRGDLDEEAVEEASSVSKEVTVNDEEECDTGEWTDR